MAAPGEGVGRNRRRGGGPLDGCDYLGSSSPGIFTLRRNTLFSGADRVSDAIPFDREVARGSELCRFVARKAGLAMVSPRLGVDDFAEAVRTHIAAGEAFCLHFDCGTRWVDGFLKVDRYALHALANDYFGFDFAEQAWPMPGSCVDYIARVFIEQIPSNNQIAFLGSFRVLQPGAYNWANTPCRRESMKQSDFSKGFVGVCFEELDRSDRVAVFTPDTLREHALMIGHRQIDLTAKSLGTSAHAVPDYPPIS